MDEAILKVHFPLGSLPARGFRCPECGEEEFRWKDARALEDLAHRLGLFGVESVQRRKLQKTGNSIMVSLSPDLLREVFPDAGSGTVVQVGRQGDRIVIRADSG